MGGIYLFDSIRAWFRRRSREKKLRLAQAWPVAKGEVLDWKIVPAHEDVSSFAAPNQIEAGYYFTIDGEYFGGIFRSVAMSRIDAAKIAPATPAVNARYDPKDPDNAIVLAEDNEGNLPFRVLSGY
jgi:uncharacterized protein DUF3592